MPSDGPRAVFAGGRGLKRLRDDDRRGLRALWWLLSEVNSDLAYTYHGQRRQSVVEGDHQSSAGASVTQELEPRFDYPTVEDKDDRHLLFCPRIDKDPGPLGQIEAFSHLRRSKDGAGTD